MPRKPITDKPTSWFQPLINGRARRPYRETKSPSSGRDRHGSSPIDAWLDSSLSPVVNRLSTSESWPRPPNRASLLRRVAARFFNLFYIYWPFCGSFYWILTPNNSYLPKVSTVKCGLCGSCYLYALAEVRYNIDWCEGDNRKATFLWRVVE